MNGIILINKEKNWTSRDVVNVISKEFKTKKVGHTGTLDPLATGVLVVTIGEATKISELLTAKDKEYIAEVKLGIETDTLDITGKIIKQEKKEISKNQIEQALKEMIGTYMQTVPIYSAVKVNGKKLYEYARKNEQVTLPKKEVTIKNIELLNYNKDTFTFKTTVTKGCYIRSLIKDITKKLDTIGTMTNLIRTKQGQFDIKDTVTIDKIKQFNLIKIEDALTLKKIEVDDYLKTKIKNGCKLENRYNEPVLFIQKNLLAIYKIDEKDNTKIKPWKMFHEEENK